MATSSSVLLLHHLPFFKTPPPLHLIKPVCLTTALHFQKPILTISLNPISLSSSSRLPSSLAPSSSFISSSSSSSLAYTQILTPRVLLNEDKAFELDSEENEIEDEEEGIEAQTEQEPEPESEPEPQLKASSSANSDSALKLPNLSAKEKKELASYAHSLGKKLNCQQVGKFGVTSSLTTAFVETLEANELLKIKILNNCPGELADVVKQLEEGTGSVVVGQIGRAVILYRPSLTKLKAAEKKLQVRRVFVRKGYIPKPTATNKLEVIRYSARGRRGSSRV